VEGDDHGEAYTAILWGVGLSHENSDVAGAEAVENVEGNMNGAAMRGSATLSGSELDFAHFLDRNESIFGFVDSVNR